MEPNTAWVNMNLRLDITVTLGQKQITLVEKKKKKCSDKMTPKDSLLYPCISSLLNHHQRNFLLQQMGTNIKINNQTLFRDKLFGTPRYNCNISIKYPLNFQ